MVESGIVYSQETGGKMQKMTRRELGRASARALAVQLSGGEIVGIEWGRGGRAEIVAYLMWADRVPGDIPRLGIAPVKIDGCKPEVLNAGLEANAAIPVRFGPANMHTSGRPAEAWLVPSSWSGELGI